uniref:Uncharacterized protein n=1 Tax=Oryza rufipogon TaxID=4529 RepID=A0A0E0NBQ3_ORYRU
MRHSHGRRPSGRRGGSESVGHGSGLPDGGSGPPAAGSREGRRRRGETAGDLELTAMAAWCLELATVVAHLGGRTRGGGGGRDGASARLGGRARGGGQM